MQDQIDRLESQQKEQQQKQVTPPPSNAITLTTGEIAKSIKIGNTSLAVGGIVWAYGTLTSNTSGPGNALSDAFAPLNIPLNPPVPTNETDKVKFNAKPTRFFFRSLTPSAWGPVTTYVEADFVGSAQGNETIWRRRKVLTRIRVLLATFSLGGEVP